MKTNPCLLGIVGALLSWSPPAHAVTKTWDGSSGTNWNTAANWTNNAVPVAGDDLLFPAGAANKANTNDIASLSVRSIIFTDSGYVLTGNSVTLTGTNGINANQSSGLNSLAIPFTLATNVTVTVANSGASLGVNNTIVLNTHRLTGSGSGFCNFLGTLSGAGGSFAKLGSGTNRISGLSGNSFVGGASVGAGTLELAKTAGLNAVLGSLTIGDGSGAVDSTVVRLLSANQILDTTAVTIEADGLLDLNGNSEAIGSLTVTGGDVATGAGTLTLGGDVTANASTNPAAISGNLSLGSATRTFDIADGAPSRDLTISAVINGDAGVGIAKTGPGILRLSGTNTYSGLTTVDTLYLEVSNPSALGSTASGTTLSGTGKLLLTGVMVAGEPLTNTSISSVLDSTGAAGWSGNVVLNASLFILINSGTNDISGAISGTGGLTKNGAGTFILSGPSANTYAGTTTVNVGTLLLNKSPGVVAIPGALVIGDGVGGVNADVVRLEANSQLSDLATVTIASSGLLDTDGFTEVAGPISGSGNLQLDASIFSVSITGGEVAFDGSISGSNTLLRNGAGTWILNGTSTFSGGCTINGKTIVNGILPANLITVNNTLGGTGTVGRVTLAGSGTLSPGSSPGRLTTSNLTFIVNSKFRVELNGPAPGDGYDQVKVNGTVNNLANATLNATLGFPSAISNSFTIIDNDGTDAVTNTFLGLPEGATLNFNGTPFGITYQGGTGNDVVLTQLTALQQPLLNLALFGTTRAVLSWETNFTGFTLEANTNLNSTVWAVVTTVPAINGTNFVVTNLASGDLEKYFRLRGP